MTVATDILNAPEADEAPDAGAVAQPTPYDLVNLALCQTAFEAASKEGKITLTHCTHAYTHTHTLERITHMINTHDAYVCAARWQAMYEAAKKAGSDYHKFKLILADPWYQEDKKPSDADLVPTHVHSLLQLLNNVLIYNVVHVHSLLPLLIYNVIHTYI